MSNLTKGEMSELSNSTATCDETTILMATNEERDDISETEIVIVDLDDSITEVFGIQDSAESESFNKLIQKDS
jgi:hypothetical protein